VYLLVLSENYKTSLHSRTTVFPGFAGTFSFGARLTPLNLALLEKREKQRFNEFCHSPFCVGFLLSFQRTNDFLNILDAVLIAPFIHFIGNTFHGIRINDVGCADLNRICACHHKLNGIDAGHDAA
jgi:hypothetical protein